MSEKEELTFKFPCGCVFVQEGEGIKPYDGLPRMSIDYYKIPLTCPHIWELAASGRTRGVFQLKSNLGRGYSKKLEPTNIDHISALAAILRPGSMNSMLDGVSMTNHYIERKNGNEAVTYIDDRVEKYLKETYGIMVYQEQALAIARDLAGFNPIEAYDLQKAISKKKADKMAALKDKFIAGCLKNGVSDEVAHKIFDNIESSNRYSFCKGHSYSYGYMSVWTLYAKAHFPLHFFCASLKFPKDDDERGDLLSEVSLFNIPLKTPTIENLSSRYTIKDGCIYYGIGEVKSVGIGTAESLINEIVQIEKEMNKPAAEFSWYEFLILVSPKTDSRSVYNLVSCGFVNDANTTRTRQLAEYKAFSNLTGKPELDFIQRKWKDYNNLTDLIKGMLDESVIKVVKKKEEQQFTVTKQRRAKVTSVLASLENPGSTWKDTTKWICDVETELLGTAISASRTAKLERLGNLKCLDFSLGRGYNDLKIVCEVIDVDERIIKSGKNTGRKFANLKLKDTSGEIECTIFSAEWAELRGDMVVGNVILLSGKRNQDKTLRVEGVQVL